MPEHPALLQIEAVGTIQIAVRTRRLNKKRIDPLEADL